MQFHCLFIQTVMINHLVTALFLNKSDVDYDDLSETDNEDPVKRSIIKYSVIKGDVWPLPRSEYKRGIYYGISPLFYVELDSNDTKSDLLVSVTNLFLTKIAKLRAYTNESSTAKPTFNYNYKGEITMLKINIEECCETIPHLKMSETYKLRITSNIFVYAKSIWGVIRALDTVVQLCYINDEKILVVNANIIDDTPIYPHRGLMLDTESHYISVDNILKMLDAMALNKMNVLHWRIVGDTSFPYESEVLPNLSVLGAFHSTMVYNASSIKKIVDFATLRGIRVIPEFNIPGHVSSIAKSYPELLTTCFKYEPPARPLNPLNHWTYKLLRMLLIEVQERFPDDYIYFGGENVGDMCWNSNPETLNYIKDEHNNLPLHLVFLKRLLDDNVLGPHKRLIVAQDLLNHVMVDLVLHNKTIGQAYSEELYNKMTNRHHHPTILSWPWDLSKLNNVNFSEYQNLRRFYEDASSIDDMWRLCIGGEAILFGDRVDDTNIFDRVWPRACIAADVLWHGLDELNDFRNPAAMNLIHKRIEEQVHRMALLGFPVPPIGPGYNEFDEEIKNTL